MNWTALSRGIIHVFYFALEKSKRNLYGSKIYRDVKDITPSALPEPIATLSNGETEWRDTTAAPGATYYYLLTVTANGKTVASSSQKYTIVIKRGIGPMTILNGNDRLGFMGAVPYDEQWLPSQMPPAFLAMFLIY